MNVKSLPGHGKGTPSSSQSQTLSGCSEQSLALETHQPEWVDNITSLHLATIQKGSVYGYLISRRPQWDVPLRKLLLTHQRWHTSLLRCWLSLCWLSRYLARRVRLLPSPEITEPFDVTYHYYWRVGKERCWVWVNGSMQHNEFSKHGKLAQEYQEKVRCVTLRDRVVRSGSRSLELGLGDQLWDGERTILQIDKKN